MTIHKPSSLKSDYTRHKHTQLSFSILFSVFVSIMTVNQKLLIVVQCNFAHTRTCFLKKGILLSLNTWTKKKASVKKLGFFFFLFQSHLGSYSVSKYTSYVSVILTVAHAVKTNCYTHFQRSGFMSLKCIQSHLSSLSVLVFLSYFGTSNVRLQWVTWLCAGGLLTLLDVKESMSILT